MNLKSIFLYFLLIAFSLNTYGQGDSAVIARLFMEGNHYSNQEKFDSALVCFYKAEELCLDGKFWEQYVRCQNELGIVMHKKQNLQLAFDYYRKAFNKGKEIWGEEHTNMGNCYFNVAFELVHDKKLDSAYYFIDMARVLWIEKHGETDDYVAMACNKLAFISMSRVRFDDAHKWFLHVLKIRLEKYGPGHPKLAGCYGNLGSFNRITGNYDKSIEYHLKSIDLFRAISPPDYKGIAAFYNNISLAYADKGDVDKAIEYQKTALGIRLAHLPPLHEDIAASYNNMSSFFYTKRNFRESLNYEKKSLAIKRANKAIESPLIAKSLNNIGLYYYEIGDYKQALEFQLEALQIRQNSLAADNPEIAESYTNLGNLSRKTGDHDKAIHYFGLSTELYKQAFGNSNINIGVNLKNTGRVYENREQLDSALVYYHHAYNLYNTCFESNHPDKAKCLMSIARILLKRENPDSALFFNNQAIQMLVYKDNAKIPGYNSRHFEKVIYKPELFDVLALQSEIYMAKGKLHGLQYNKMALEIQQCLTLLSQWVRYNMFEEDSKLIFTTKLPHAMHKAVENSFMLYNGTNNLDYLAEGFKFSECLKSGVLTESILESQAKLIAGVPDSILQLEKKYRIDVNSVERQIARYVPSQSSPIDVDSLENQLFENREKLKELRDRTETTYPIYQTLKSGINYPQPSDICLKLLENEAMLSYCLSGKTLYFFVFSNSGSIFRSVSIPESFSEIVRKYIISINKTRVHDLDRLSPVLYQYLIKPVFDVISQYSHINIIPDGELWMMPFEALFPEIQKSDTHSLGSRDFLIKSKSISYHMSASLWNMRRSNTKEPGKKLASKFEFVGFAPVFDGKDSVKESACNIVYYADTLYTEIASRSGGINRWQLRPLPYSRFEVETIHDLFFRKNHSSALFLHEDANKKNFIEYSNQANILHIASHATMNSAFPESTGIFFAPTRNATDSIGSTILYSSETYNIPMKADLLVLSACDTGTGKLWKGEGVIGLTRGFIYAGASNIMYSLWKIGDENTRELMVAFYKNYLSGMSYPEALRFAKLEFINREETSFPKFWGGMVLIGR